MKAPTFVEFKRIATPLGTMVLAADDRGLVGVWFVGQEHFAGPGPDWREVASSPVLDAAAAQLAEYFAGLKREFALPLAPRGTPFQQRVWRCLSEIPFGHTTTYGAVAARLGNAGAARAVGAATGRNPISIVVPCHRVIGADGTLTGYAGGEDRKRYLLDMERGGRLL